MSLTGPADGEPTKVAVGIADVMTGMYAATAILAALRHRDRTGEGQHIDLALVECQIAWLVNEGTNYLVSGQSPKRRGNQHPNIVPYQVLEAADGHFILAVGNDVQFAKFCEVIGEPSLAVDPAFMTNHARLANRSALIHRIAAIVKAFERRWLISELEKRSVPAGPIHTLPEVFASDQVEARGMKVTMACPGVRGGAIDVIGNPIKMSRTPVTYRRPPPQCGADTEAVLAELRTLTATDL